MPLSKIKGLILRHMLSGPLSRLVRPGTNFWGSPPVLQRYNHWQNLNHCEAISVVRYSWATVIRVQHTLTGIFVLNNATGDSQSHVRRVNRDADKISG